MKVLNILTRQHLDLAQFDAAVAFYEGLLGQEARLRLTLLDGRLRIAQVASMLLIGADPALLDAIAGIRAAYLVEDIAAFAEQLPRQGATIVEPLTEIATGRSMVVRHPDGLLVEYVEHTRKHPADRLPGA
ncbi:VOC family protein [Methylibium petroleiphilum]|uniref:VOC family protein n=1 Tax=Methylibium petroleiphilum TaxID=105560 RepID=UPI003D2E67C2